MVRLENMIDMQGWKGLNRVWPHTSFPKTKQFAADVPMSFLAATFAKTLTFPIDRVAFAAEATLLNTNKKLNPLEVLYKPNAGGFGKLWSGGARVYGRYLPQMTLLLSINENTQTRWLSKADPTNVYLYGLRAITAGAIAGGITTALIYPLDFARIILAPDFVYDRKWLGLIKCLERNYIEHGFEGIYRGLGTSMLGSAVYRGLQFGMFETAKLITEEQNPTPSFWFVFGLAQGSCTTAAIISYPFEGIRRRLIYAEYPGYNFNFWNGFDCAKRTIKKGGVGALYKGLHIAILRSFGAALLLTTFEKWKVKM